MTAAVDAIRHKLDTVEQLMWSRYIPMQVIQPGIPLADLSPSGRTDLCHPRDGPRRRLRRRNALRDGEENLRGQSAENKVRIDNDSEYAPSHGTTAAALGGRHRLPPSAKYQQGKNVQGRIPGRRSGRRIGLVGGKGSVAGGVAGGTLCGLTNLNLQRRSRAVMGTKTWHRRPSAWCMLVDQLRVACEAANARAAAASKPGIPPMLGARASLRRLRPPSRLRMLAGPDV